MIAPLLMTQLTLPHLGPRPIPVHLHVLARGYSPLHPLKNPQSHHLLIASLQLDCLFPLEVGSIQTPLAHESYKLQAISPLLHPSDA